MITGFLFWSKVLDGCQQPIDWSRLYLSRLFRLGPLYLLTVACVILVSVCRAGFEWKESSSIVLGQVATWLMFTIPGIAPVNGFAETVPLAGAVWSLPYEWLFYACLPLGALCVRASTPLIWVLFSMTAVMTLAVVMPEVRTPMLYAFAGGIAAACLARIAAVRRTLSQGVWGGIAVACLATILLFFPTAYTLSAILLLTGAFLIIACGNSLYGLLEWPASVVLGEMAYSLYLLHGLVLFVTYRVVCAEWAAMVSSVEHWAMALCVVPVLILLCFTTFRLIEKAAMDAVPCVAAGPLLLSVLSTQGVEQPVRPTHRGRWLTAAQPLIRVRYRCVTSRFGERNWRSVRQWCPRTNQARRPCRAETPCLVIPGT